MFHVEEVDNKNCAQLTENKSSKKAKWVVQLAVRYTDTLWAAGSV